MRVCVPGKMMLAGEWSVLELGAPCIVVAVDKTVSVDIEEAAEFIIEAPDIDIAQASFDWHPPEIVWRQQFSSQQQEKLAVLHYALKIAFSYLQPLEIPCFRLKTNSQQAVYKLHDGNVAKIGMGSSAAICVAVVEAVLKFCQVEINTKIREDVYKMACLAHYFAQGKVGSGFDIAASCWGTTLMYQRFSPQWLTQNIQEFSLQDVIKSPWPSFSVESITLPSDLCVSFGFVGYSASTKNLIGKMNEYKQKSPSEYLQIIAAISDIVFQMKDACQCNSSSDILELIRQNRKQLTLLSQYSKTNIETPELALLADIAEQYGGAGKFCGAGGGDCGVALASDSQTMQRIHQNWQNNGIFPLPLKVLV